MEPNKLKKLVDGEEVDSKNSLCYMDKFVRVRPSVRKALVHNTELLRPMNKAELIKLLSEAVDEFLRLNDGLDPFFRLHYSGDFYSDTYAEAWVEVVNKYPDVTFWAYTRSFKYIRYFADIKNITIYLSADPVNQREAFIIYEKYKKSPNVGISWMGNNPPDSKKYRWVVCPEISGKLKNTEDKGACAKCRLCINNYHDKVKNVQFQLH